MTLVWHELIRLDFYTWSVATTFVSRPAILPSPVEAKLIHNFKSIEQTNFSPNNVHILMARSCLQMNLHYKPDIINLIQRANHGPYIKRTDRIGRTYILSCMHNSRYKSPAVLSLHVLEPSLTISWNEIGRCAMLEKWVLWFKVLFLHVRNAHLFSWWGSHRILAPRSPNLLTSMKYGNGWPTPLHWIAPFGTVSIDHSHLKVVPSHDTPVVARKSLNSCVFWTYMGRAQAVILKWVFSIHYHSLPFCFLIDCATGSSRSIINGPLLPLVCRLPVFNFSNSFFLKSPCQIYTVWGGNERNFKQGALLSHG